MIRQFDARQAAGRKLLLVDAEYELQEALSFRLRKAGFEVVCVRQAHEALEVVEKDTLDMVIIDPKLIDMNGVKLGSMIREKSGVPFLFVTSGSTATYEDAAIAVGALTILSKRSNMDDLVTQIQMAIKQAREFATTQKLNKRLVKKLHSSEKREALIGAYMQLWGEEKKTVKSTLDQFARSRNVSIDELAELHAAHGKVTTRIRRELGRQLKEIEPALIGELGRFYEAKEAKRTNSEMQQSSEVVTQRRIAPS